MSIGPGGAAAYVPCLYSNEAMVIDLKSRRIAWEKPTSVKKPFMGTVSWNGRYWTVETNQGDGGGVIVYSLKNPMAPEQLAVLGKAQGLGTNPHTDEFTPDGRYDLVIDNGSSQVSVIDLAKLKVVKNIQLPEGSAPTVGAFSPDGTKFYVSLTKKDAVAVIDVAKQDLLRTIPIGTAPAGIVAGSYDWVKH
jgi:YVTN family beta-propeller protein